MTGIRLKLAVLLPVTLLAAVVFDVVVVIGGFYMFGDPHLSPGRVAPEFAEGTGSVNRCLTAAAGFALLLSNPLALTAEGVACLALWQRTRRALPLVAAVAALPVIYLLTLGAQAGAIWRWVLGH